MLTTALSLKYYCVTMAAISGIYSKRVYSSKLGIRLPLLGTNLRNLVPNNTCLPQNFRLILWLFLAIFQDRLATCKN